MNILFTERDGQVGKPHVVALFGFGVVGGAIFDHLTLRGFQCVSTPPVSWGQRDAFSRDLHGIAHRLVELSGDDCRMSVVWAAGRAGFAASSAEVELEMTSFELVVDMVASLAANVTGLGRLAFFHVSSAGGLFEGQHNVGNASTPNPKRPYGVLKARQEAKLHLLPAAVAKRIYRPSSIYGYIEPQKRMGLIPTLIYNGAIRRVSHIFGDISTLRDYVPADDIGAFIASEVLATHPEASSRPIILAAGKPTSIFEIKKVIESVIGHKMYTSYQLNQSNAQDNSFLRCDLPKNWSSVGLVVGIRRVYHRWIEHGYLLPPPSRASVK